MNELQLNDNQVDCFDYRNPGVQLILAKLQADCDKPICEASFMNCLITAKQLNLNPLEKKIYFLPYFNSKKKLYELQPIIGIAGLRSIAHRTGMITGIKSEVIYVNSKMVGARARVSRYMPKIAREAIFEVDVPLSEFHKGNSIWNQHAPSMIKKVAEAHCLRMAFPDEMSGVYLPEEFDTDTDHNINVRDITKNSTPIPSATQQIAPSKSAHSIPEDIQIRFNQIKFLVEDSGVEQDFYSVEREQLAQAVATAKIDNNWEPVIAISRQIIEILEAAIALKESKNDAAPF